MLEQSRPVRAKALSYGAVLEQNTHAIFRFKKGERVDLFDPSHIVTVTPQTCYKLPYQGGHDKYVYVVTALDRLQNESKGVKRNVKL